MPLFGVFYLQISAVPACRTFKCLGFYGRDGASNHMTGTTTKKGFSCTSRCAQSETFPPPGMCVSVHSITCGSHLSLTCFPAVGFIPPGLTDDISHTKYSQIIRWNNWRWLELDAKQRIKVWSKRKELRLCRVCRLPLMVLTALLDHVTHR